MLHPIVHGGSFRTVTLWVISPDTRSERRFDLHITVGQLKVWDLVLNNSFSYGVLTPDVLSLQNKLELITGIPVSNQALSLYNGEEDSQPVAALEDGGRPLGFYGARDWQFLKVLLIQMSRTASIVTCI